jgi:hypothetical protein
MANNLDSMSVTPERRQGERLFVVIKLSWKVIILVKCVSIPLPRVIFVIPRRIVLVLNQRHWLILPYGGTATTPATVSVTDRHQPT